MDQAPWTLDELAERVDAALAVDYHGQASGRVRDVPDRRAIRWYTTIGLVDRPAAHRGRTAMYGPRHLLQLVAVKRLQARGLPLVAIQQELAGATDTQLARVARLPLIAAAPPRRRLTPLVTPPGAGPVPGSGDGLASGELPGSGSGDGLASGGHPGSGSGDGLASGGHLVPGSGDGLASGGHLVPQGARTAAGGTRPARGKAQRAGFWREPPPTSRSAADSAPAAPDGGRADGVATLRGVRLGAGATLLLDPGRTLEPADLRAIVDAARPLLDALRARGLAGSEPGREHP
jgi:hypothetical protein